MFRKPVYTDHLHGFALPERELREIARHTATTTVEPGTVLCEQGDAAVEAVLVLDGAVRVTDAGIEIATHTGPTVVGEMAFVSDRPYRTARVVATAPTHVAVASPREFRHLLGTCPEFAAYVRSLVAARVRASS